MKYYDVYGFLYFVLNSSAHKSSATKILYPSSQNPAPQIFNPAYEPGGTERFICEYETEQDMFAIRSINAKCSFQISFMMKLFMMKFGKGDVVYCTE